MTQPSKSGSLIGILIIVGGILIFAAGIVAVSHRNSVRVAEDPAPLVPNFSIPIGQVGKPMPYRIVSFHRGRADKNLIKLAAQLGFNGVQFQIEGSNEQGIADFAARDAKEHLVDYCHSLNMTVTVWVHELSDLPGEWMPEYLGAPTSDNDRLFDYLGQRYEWILGTAIPNVDGLCLTVVETQIRATKTPILMRLSNLIAKKCEEHHKSFMLRTFVWKPEELEGVMGAVNQLPEDMVIMSKAVPQDWQMRGANAAEIGAVGKRPQIIEFDAEGEYFLHNMVANCMPDLLKRQFDYAVSKGAQGICVRVDRYDDSVLFQPSEVNVWTLGMLASGASNSTEDIWNRWASYRFSPKAAAGVIRALKPTAEVVAELLSVGPFTFGDTRRAPPLPDEELMLYNWQNWLWDKSYMPAHDAAERGDAEFIRQVTQQKADAMKVAKQCLADLETVKPELSATEYAILHTKLLTNAAQLAVRTPMVLADLEYRAAINAGSDGEHEAHLKAVREHVAEMRAVLDPPMPLPMVVSYLGRNWYLGPPEGIDRNLLLFWAYDTELLVNGEREPLPKAVERVPDPLHP